MGKNDVKFSDHVEEESFREQRGREIELGFKHPYGKLAPLHSHSGSFQTDHPVQSST
jgi:hypothetical protein